MNLDTFKRISQEINEIGKLISDFEFFIQDNSAFQRLSYVELTKLDIKTVEQLALVSSYCLLTGSTRISIPENVISADVKNNNIRVIAAPYHREHSDAILKTYPASAQLFPKRLHSLISSSYLSQPNYQLSYLYDDLPEVIEKNITYRLLWGPQGAISAVPHTDPEYIHLDKNFLILHNSSYSPRLKFVTGLTEATRKSYRYLIINELTVDTIAVIAAIILCPNLCKYLSSSVINSATIKLTRIKMEKDEFFKHKDNLAKQQEYKAIVAEAIAMYEKRTNAGLIRKIRQGELVQGTYNDIKLTKTSAVYDTISIEADNFIDTICDNLVFDERTDIYGLIRAYITHQVKSLEAELKEKDSNLSRTCKINGITVTISRKLDNDFRYINDIRINKDELVDVAYRASCMQKTDQFEKFLKSVTTFSLAWHDMLIQGIPMKLHSNITFAEYCNAEAGSACPRIKFFRDDDGFKLKTDSEKKEGVLINFSMAIKKLKKLNRRINNAYHTENGYRRRDYNWGREELSKVLKECCTFTKKKKNKDGVVEETTICTLSDELAAKMGAMANDFHEKALEKSKNFLETAIKATGAKEIVYATKPALLVEGTLRKYAVIKENNSVYAVIGQQENGDYYGRFICIVEPGHQVSVGCDATAARLYALKNDSVTVGAISTLRKR